MPDEKRMTHEVSLSTRYKKMIVCVMTEVKMLRTERPCMLSTFLQKEISFLNARKSNTVCRTETVTVTPSSKGFVSRRILFSCHTQACMSHHIRLCSNAAHEAPADKRCRHCNSPDLARNPSRCPSIAAEPLTSPTTCAPVQRRRNENNVRRLRSGTL